jgi:1-aminocyclopropane-1-carboxylate deaminase
MKFPSLASPCVALSPQICNEYFAGVAVWIKRDDLLHPQVSGNKFRKLKYILSALAPHEATLVTMGGIWSNHVHATAHAAHLSGLPAIGLIRAAEGMDSAMLDDCRALGMRIQFVSREAYRRLRDDAQAWREYVPELIYDAIWLPEGGSAPEALHGVAELVDELPFLPDAIAVACGTGATLAGVLAGLRGRSQVIGIPVLKNAEFLHQDIARLLTDAGYQEQRNYALHHDFHHGGYGKAPAVLRDFCTAFANDTGIPIEPIYTGKLFYALREICVNGRLQRGQTLIAIHTGGMQGARGMMT